MCPNGGTPPIGKPVASRTASASTRLALRAARRRRQLRFVELVGAAHVRQHDLAVDGEDQALHDLADLDADRCGRIGRGLRTVGEATGIDDDAEFTARVDDAADVAMDCGGGV